VTPHAPRRLLVATAALVVAASLVLAFGHGSDAARQERQRTLQHSVGGLGAGPSLDLRRGAAAFDPRVGTRALGGAPIVAPGAPPP
jgi:hypothetical protein